MRLYLLHPAAVHFPIALLAAAFAAEAFGQSRGRAGARGDAAAWLLWTATAGAWVSLGLGLLAQRSAPHVPPAWETLALHRSLGWWTAGLSTALSGWRYAAPGRASKLFLAACAAALALALWTGFLGGELVFTHNMGTAASQE